MCQCDDCIHDPICDLWRNAEQQDASMYVGGDDEFECFEPARKWISIRDRMPEHFMCCYVALRSLVDDRENWVVETVFSPFRDLAGEIPYVEWGKAEPYAWMEKVIPEPPEEVG